MSYQESMDKLMAVPGKGAAFVRGFLENDSDKLRERQDAGVAFVEALGGNISVSYASKLSKMMELATVITKVKRGRNWFVKVDDALSDQVLENEAYGSEVEIVMKTEDIVVRSSFADYLDKKGAVLTTHNERLPKEAFRLAMERFHKGELDMVFVSPDAKFVNYKYEGKERSPKVWKP